MDTLKNIIKFTLLLIIVYILVNLLAYAFISKTYNNISDYDILVDSPTITITESRGTRINGYVTGKIRNNTESTITGQYIRLNFYNTNGQYVGTNYIELDNFKQGKTLEFRTSYNYLKVSKFTVDVTSEKVDVKDSRPWFMHPDSSFARFMSVVGILMIIWYVL